MEGGGFGRLQCSGVVFCTIVCEGREEEICKFLCFVKVPLERDLNYCELKCVGYVMVIDDPSDLMSTCVPTRIRPLSECGGDNN